MIVVDANIVAYLYLPRDHTTRAERLLEQDPEDSPVNGASATVFRLTDDS